MGLWDFIFMAKHESIQIVDTSGFTGMQKVVFTVISMRLRAFLLDKIYGGSEVMYGSCREALWVCVVM